MPRSKKRHEFVVKSYAKIDAEMVAKRLKSTSKWSPKSTPLPPLRALDVVDRLACETRSSKSTESIDQIARPTESTDRIAEIHQMLDDVPVISQIVENLIKLIDLLIDGPTIKLS